MEIYKKIGIYGGSFNPFHYGHLLLARMALTDFGLDEVIIVPCNQSNYKDKQIEVNGHERLQLIYRSLVGIENISASSIEIERGGITKTIDTIEYFKYQYPKDDLFLICGLDTEKKIDTWYKIEEIKKLSTIIYAGKDFFMPEINIRSSIIRERIKNFKSVDGMLSDFALGFINQRNLYGRVYEEN